MELSTKLTLLLTWSTMRMNVKLQRPRCAGCYQVKMFNFLREVDHHFSLKIKRKLLFKMNLISRTVAKMDKVVLANWQAQIFHFSSICKGLSRVNSTKLDPKTCSERICQSSEYLLYATWISSKVHISTSIFCKRRFILQVESGCNCCEVNGELVPDKQTWVVGEETYGNNVKYLSGRPKS